MGMKINIRAALAADVPVNGTFTVPYPSGHTQATLNGSYGGQVRVNDNEIFRQAIGAQFVFGPTDITVQNISPIAWPAMSYLRIGFDLAPRNGSHNLTLGPDRNQAMPGTGSVAEAGVGVVSFDFSQPGNFIWYPIIF